MILSVEINHQIYKVDIKNPLNLAIPLNFDGAQPNIYEVAPAMATAFEGGNFIGDTRRGGSCNFEDVKFNPHCNGTHTECVGHITNKRISVHDCLRDVFLLATLISVVPENARETDETYAVELDEADKLLTRKALENSKFKIQNSKFTEALIIRTLPNDTDKKNRHYAKNPPPFFSTEAMRFINETGVKHLLVDTPSIDRMFDEGKLSNHRIFWNVTPESFAVTDRSSINKTITEMIFAADEIPDGNYLLNLQIAPFAADAAPSRPILFKILE